MPSTEAPKRTRRKPASANGNGKVAVAPADIEAIVDFINGRVLIERGPVMRVVVLATLAGKNAHLRGLPGTAKSHGLRELSRCIVGTTTHGEQMAYFEKPLNPSLAPDAVIGTYDIEEFARSGRLERNVDGYAPAAHFVFIDEIFRANGMMMDALLPLMNTGERHYEANGGMARANALVVVTASNHVPEDMEAETGALVDRVTLMAEVDPLKSGESFKELLRRDDARRRAEADGSFDTDRKTITLEQLIEAQRQVRFVRMTPEYEGEAEKLWRDVRGEGIYVSERRWLELVDVSRANAWLAGRDFLIPDDLAVCVHGIARNAGQMVLARKLIQPYLGRFESAADAKRVEMAEQVAVIAEIRPEVENTPPNVNIEPNVMRRAVAAARSLQKIQAEIDSLLSEAEKEQRDAAALRDVRTEVATNLDWFLQNDILIAKKR